MAKSLEKHIIRRRGFAATILLGRRLELDEALDWTVTTPPGFLLGGSQPGNLTGRFTFFRRARKPLVRCVGIQSNSRKPALKFGGGEEAGASFL